MLNSNSSDQGFGVFKQARCAGYGTISLFGVLHFGTADMFPLPQTLIQTFEEAQTVAFETNLDELDSGGFNDSMALQGTLDSGGTLEDMLAPQTWQALLETASSLGFSESFIRRLQPWYCSALMTSAAMRNTGLDSYHGVDAALFQDARDHQKDVLCLETPQEQLEILSEVNLADTDSFLRQTLEEIREMPEFTEKMLSYWLDGNQDALASLIQEGFADCPTLQNRLLDRRNGDWYRKLSRAAENGRPVLAVVGAGHLVGTQSLPQIFQRHGFMVDGSAMTFLSSQPTTQRD